MSSLKKILIKTKREVFSELIGNHTTLFSGEGFDFFELREYQIGDDVKNIDWITTAKKQKPFVKVFHKEHQTNIVVANILNGSIFFGSTKLKQTVAAEVASILMYSSIKSGDNFTNYIFADKLYAYSKPSKK